MSHLSWSWFLCWGKCCKCWIKWFLWLVFQELRIYALNYQRSFSPKHPVKWSSLTCRCSSAAYRWSHDTRLCVWEFMHWMTCVCLCVCVSGFRAFVRALPCHRSLRHRVSEGLPGGSLGGADQTLQVSQSVHFRSDTYCYSW